MLKQFGSTISNRFNNYYYFFLLLIIDFEYVPLNFHFLSYYTTDSDVYKLSLNCVIEMPGARLGFRFSKVNNIE